MQKIMAKNFRELRKKMSPEAQEKARVLAQKYSEKMSLGEIKRRPADREQARQKIRVIRGKFLI
jgi:hypothetical protein